MLNNISWTDYIMAVGIALVIYYLFIGLKYYSEDIKDLLSGKRRFKLKPAPSVAHNRQHEQDVKSGPEEFTGYENSRDDEFMELEHLIGRLKTIIEDASRRKMVPQEFKQYLTMILKEYPSIKDSPLRSSVNEMIISECQKYGTVILNEEEMDSLWVEVV